MTHSNIFTDNELLEIWAYIRFLREQREKLLLASNNGENDVRYMLARNYYAIQKIAVVE